MQNLIKSLWEGFWDALSSLGFGMRTALFTVIGFLAIALFFHLCG